MRFPSSRRGLQSFTSLHIQTHRKCGSIGSRGTAADRGRRAERQPYGILGVNRGGTSTGTGYLGHKLAFLG